MSSKINLNIFGTCCLRDIFSVHDDDGVSVNRFIQSVNPVSACSKSPISVDKYATDFIDWGGYRSLTREM